MKKFTVNCDFGGQIAPFAVYIGAPEGGHHPLHFQADWLSKNRGGSIPPDIMDAVGRLKDLAEKNKVSLEELCVYALGAAQQEKDEEQQTMNPSEASASIAAQESASDPSLETKTTSDDDFDFDDLVSSPKDVTSEPANKKEERTLKPDEEVNLDDMLSKPNGSEQAAPENPEDQKKSG